MFIPTPVLIVLVAVAASIIVPFAVWIIHRNAGAGGSGHLDL